MPGEKMMERQILLITLLLLSAGRATHAASRPNLIFFLTDDQRNDTLGCAGHPIVKTPVIDQLAQGGVRFANAFVTTSICAASRASLLTGLYERSHRYTFGTPPIAKGHTDRSYPTLLRQAGYRTGFVGKFGVAVTQGTQKAMFDVFEPLGQGRPPYFRKQPDGSLRHLTEIVGDHAIKFLKTNTQEQPFCLSVSFNASHAVDGDKENHYPWPQAVDGMYDDITIPAPRLSEPEVYDAHPAFMKESMNRDRFFWRWDTPEKYQKNMRAYFRMLSGIDHVIGRVLKALKAQGLAENTVVIYSGDNGYYMGQRGFAGKWSHYEESLRVPLIVYDPRPEAGQRGRVLDPMALNIDISATLLDLAGVAVPKAYQGCSLTPWLRGSQPNWRKDFFCEHLMANASIPMWEGVRGQRYVYARYFQQQPVYEFLHDLQKAPDQLKNLAEDPQHARVLRHMRLRTDDLRDSYGGPYSVEAFPSRGGAALKQAHTKAESLFNGKNLDGWKGDPKLWSVKGGCIIGVTTNEDPIPANTFLIWEGKPVKNFELTLKLLMKGNNNSGIQYRSREFPEAGKFVVGGYQMDIHANPPYTGMLYEERGRGIVAQRPTRVVIEANGNKGVQAIRGEFPPIKLDQWNEYTVIAKGNRLVHEINGKVTVEIVDGQKGKAAPSGIIALQLHRGPAMEIRVKDIRLKRLP
jgi:choline-sulfatase